MHNLFFASYLTIHLIQKIYIHVIYSIYEGIYIYIYIYLLLCWNFPNQIASYNAIDIFENLTMSTGALTWIENFWSYNAKVID
jgi:hypothetical protein